MAPIQPPPEIRQRVLDVLISRFQVGWGRRPTGGSGCCACLIVWLVGRRDKEPTGFLALGQDMGGGGVWMKPNLITGFTLLTPGGLLGANKVSIYRWDGVMIGSSWPCSGASW